MGISAVILTHNSASTLKQALDSVMFCDEVIIIDDASTDATVAIAQKLGVTVYHRSLNQDFAAQRNFGISKATHTWVLFVDDDEIVPKDLQVEIHNAVNRIDAHGFFLRREDVLWGHVLRYGETANVRLLRLAQKNKGTWKRSVHEVWDVPGVVGTLTHALRHTPHPTVADFLADVNDYSTINAAYFFDTGVRTNVWQIIGFPLAKFFQNYIWRRGFMDGMPGIIVSLMMSFHSFLTRSKLWQMQRQ